VVYDVHTVTAHFLLVFQGIIGLSVRIHGFREVPITSLSIGGVILPCVYEGIRLNARARARDYYIELDN
jgi:hypothetical protein